MADAMRARGLDETKLTTKLNKLLDSKNEKMRFEVVKECGKFLEAYPTPRTAPAPDSVPVQFVTSVPRPAREEAVAPSSGLAVRPATSFAPAGNFAVLTQADSDARRQ